MLDRGAQAAPPRGTSNASHSSVDNSYGAASDARLRRGSGGKKAPAARWLGHWGRTEPRRDHRRRSPDFRSTDAKIVVLNGSGEAETDPVTSVLPHIAIAAARTRALRSIVPRTAATDPMSKVFIIFPNIPIMRWIARISFVPWVGAPLPDIPDHIVRAPGVGRKAIDFGRTFVLKVSIGVGGIPLITPPAGGRNASPARILPFCLGRQAIG